MSLAFSWKGLKSIKERPHDTFGYNLVSVLSFGLAEKDTPPVIVI